MSRTSIELTLLAALVIAPVAGAQRAARPVSHSAADAFCLAFLRAPAEELEPPAVASAKAAPAQRARLEDAAASRRSGDHAQGESMPPVPLPASRVAWDLDATGTVASGTLEVAYANDADEPRTAALLLRSPASVTVERAEIELEGKAMPLALHRLRDEPAPRTLRGRVRGTAPSDVWNSADVELPPSATAVVRLTVSATGVFARGAFRLALPLVSPTCEMVGPSVSPDLDVRLLVRHAGDMHLLGEPPLPVETETVDGGTRLRLTGAARADVDRFDITWTVDSADDAIGEAWSREAAPSSAGSEPSKNVTVLLTAPRHPDVASVRAKDVVFVVDASGSMRGPKIAEARKAARACVAALAPDDAFDILAFNRGQVAYRDAPVVASAEARAAADRWLEAITPAGGTVLSPALAAALALRREGGGHRLVVLVSDAKLADERDVLALVRDRLGDARLLVIAIGEDANHDAADHIASLGRGEAVHVADAAGIAAAMTSLLSTFGAPVAWDLRVDWGGARVLSQSPERVPDLYADRPVLLRARVAGAAPSELHVRGATTAGPDGFDLTVPVQP